MAKVSEEFEVKIRADTTELMREINRLNRGVYWYMFQQAVIQYAPVMAALVTGFVIGWLV